MEREKKPTIGFPRMLKEPGEKRVFLPQFIHYLSELGFNVLVEEDYGSRSGLSLADFQAGGARVESCSHEEAYQQDIVMVLRSPNPAEMALMRPGACLISMLHYPTRPRRVARLKELGIKSISLDSIVNDVNLRLVEDMRAVAWNGLEAAFGALESCFPGFHRPGGEPFRALILGTGMVGKHAVEAATKLGSVERNRQHIRSGGPGSLAISVGRSLTHQPDRMKILFEQADLLVDATQRSNPSLPVVPNEWIAWLPRHAVIADLAVDPYTLDIDPPVVRGVEGIPQGSLDQYIYHPSDPNWERTIPPQVPTANRRTTATCYSWPGIHPEASMHHYAKQLEPLMDVLAQTGYDGLSLRGGYFERALYRATLRAWLEDERYEARPR
jgi:alanine dehydrogenase